MNRMRIFLMLSLALYLALPAYATVIRPRYVGKIMPTPKQVVYEDTFMPLVRNGAPVAALLTGPNPSPAEQSAVEEIESLLGVELPAAKPGDRRVISVGRTTLAEESMRRRPAGVNDEGFDKEGYVLRFEREGDSERVILYGPGKRGTLYAAMSFCQLIRLNGNSAEVRRADITDWPTFLVRCSPPLEYGSTEEVDFRARFKVNMQAMHGYWPVPDIEPGQPIPRLKALQEVAGYGVQTGKAGVLQHLNPYSAKSDGAINILDPEDIRRIVDFFDASMAAGAEGIMMCLDDLCREITYEEIIQFRSTGHAHAYLFNKIYERLKPKYPDGLFLLLPIPYSGYPTDELAGDYMATLSYLLPQDVGLVWTGPGGQALSVTNSDVDLRASFCNGRKPFFWDNSAVYLNRPVEGQFLQPYRTKLAPDLAYRFFARGTHILWLVDEINLVTWADCLWNPDAYDPDKSWRRALAMLAGEENVDRFIELSDLWLKMRTGLVYGEGLLDSFAEYDKALGRMKQLHDEISRTDAPKFLCDRVSREEQKLQKLIADWKAHVDEVRKHYAEAEKEFSRTASNAPELDWRYTQGNGWTCSESSAGLSGSKLDRPCLMMSRDPVYFSDTCDDCVAEARIALPDERDAGLMFLMEDGDVSPAPAPDAPEWETRPLLSKRILLNGECVWESGDGRRPAAENVTIRVPDELRGKPATLGLVVAPWKWNNPRTPEKVCLIGPVVVKGVQPAPTKEDTEADLLAGAQAALETLPESFSKKGYSGKSYSELLECVISDPALANIESRIPQDARISVARGMWEDNRPAKAIECLLRKGEVVHERPGGSITGDGISEVMSPDTKQALMKDRPVAFCRKSTANITIDGLLDDWSDARWTRLNENVSVASYDKWMHVKKVLNPTEDHTSKVYGSDSAERRGRERFVSFNRYHVDSDIGAKFAAKWDDDFLYLVLDVSDDILCSIDANRTWKGDHVEFCIDALNDQTDLPWADDSWYEISVLQTMSHRQGRSRGLDTEAIWRLEPRHRGYVLEMAIPLEEICITPFDGQKMGFNARVKDRDSKYEAKSIWWRAIKEPLRIHGAKRTFGWGELQFIGAAGPEM